MKKYMLVAVGLMIVLTNAFAADKKLEPPPPGKAVVYIGKMNSFVGGAMPIHFFADDNYLGRIKGKKFVRYVSDPGEHVFWVAGQSSRRTFVKAQLEAGHSYALYAKIGAELVPMTQQSKGWREFRKMIRKKKPFVMDADYYAEWVSGRPDYISKALAEWKTAGEPALNLSSDDYIQ